MKPFHLSVAEGIRQNPQNSIYAHEVEITSLDDFKQAVQWDNCAAIFKDNHRSVKNFILADCVMMDCDNEKSDNPQDCMTPEKLKERIQNVQFVIVYSRNHMKDKETLSARPRFHVYLPLSKKYSEADLIRLMKEKLLRVIPEFDAGAKDAARFFFGVDNPVCEFHEGNICIDEFLDALPDFELSEYKHDAADAEHNSSVELEDNDNEVIPVGKRNNTIFEVALRAVRKYGNSEKAKQVFDNACSRCKPPLPSAEISATWNSAIRIAKSFKDKYTPKKINLSMPVIEDTLKELGIEIKRDVITRKLYVSDMPSDSAFVHEGYYTMNQDLRSQANIDMLPLVLSSTLRDKHYAFSENFLTQSISVIAITHSFNPFFDMIQNTTWDGKNRIYELCQALGITSENLHYMRFLEKWLWQVVSMSLNDNGTLGNEFVLVLQGKQGIGKTSFFRRLAVRPEWFLEGANIDVHDKDAIMRATQVVICELGELDSTLKREQTNLKGFITSPNDVFREPYGKRNIMYPRRTSFCGTVNPEQFLRDETGNRRYAVIPVTYIDKQFIHNVMTPDYCAQLWRQVYEQYYLKRGKNGFYLTEEEMQFVMSENQNATVLKDGEIELYDLLDFNSNPSAWRWITNTDIRKELELTHISSRRMGDALTAIMMKDSRVKKKHDMQGSKYLLPKKKGMYD